MKQLTGNLCLMFLVEYEVLDTPDGKCLRAAACHRWCPCYMPTEANCKLPEAGLGIQE